MLRDQGKKLPTPGQYAELLLPFDNSDDIGLVNQFGAFTDSEPGLVFAVESNPEYFRLVPGPEFSPRLYRGQVNYHDPCKSSLYRERSELCRSYWFAKVGELACVLTSHPALCELMDWQFEGYRFDLNFGAIAQHYGYPTSFIDFSRSKDIAMFFAMCEWDDCKKEFHPAEEGEAVLYTLDLRGALLGDNGNSLLPMGGEPLQRPTAQRAFALELGPKDNLDDLPWVECSRFQRTEQMAQEYWEKYEGGKALLPDNAFDNYIVSIKDNGKVWEPAARMAFKDKADDLLPDLRQKGLVSDEFEGPKQEILISTEAEWQSWRKAYYDLIRYRGVSEHYDGVG